MSSQPPTTGSTRIQSGVGAPVRFVSTAQPIQSRTS